MRLIVSNVIAMLIVGLGTLATAWGADPSIAQLKEPPTGVSPEIAAAIEGAGYRISSNEGVVCDLWFAKQVDLKPKFKPTLRVKYPFQTGQLIGVIRFPETSKPNDFRGQELKPGVYTLRYGLQPDDGNHLGTSDIRDFLVGCSPADDASPARIAELKKLFRMSGKASGTSHPAIFLLLPPPEKGGDKPALSHDDDKHYLILDANVNAKDAEAMRAVPLRVVTLGKSEG